MTRKARDDPLQTNRTLTEALLTWRAFPLYTAITHAVMDAQPLGGLITREGRIAWRAPFPVPFIRVLACVGRMSSYGSRCR